MMRKTKLAVLVSALLWGVAGGTAAAVPVAADSPTAQQLTRMATTVGASANLRPSANAAFPAETRLAKHGADDPRPPPGCDDHGTNLCAAVDQMARKGADDPRPPPGCDDHGTNLCAAVDQMARKGADDPRPPPSCDDRGTNRCVSGA